MDFIRILSSGRYGNTSMSTEARRAGAQAHVAVGRPDIALWRGKPARPGQALIPACMAVSAPIAIPIPIAIRLRFLALVVAFFLVLASGLAHAAVPEPPSARVLHVEIPVQETTLDPAALQDLYSAQLASNLFEGLLTYDYLARPAKLVPLLAERMPTVSADGLTWLFHLRHGVYFAADPALGSAKREVHAADFIFTLSRLMDPALHSPYAFLLEGKIVGLDALAARAAKLGQPFDYQARIPGMEALDPFTLRVRLNKPDPNFGHALAQPNLGVMAAEVVRFYGDQIGAHPVGTGPYVLTRWVRGSALTLDANPNYRLRLWEFEPGALDAVAQKAAREMHGKRIPAIPRIEVRVIEEPQSAWLAFQRGELDVLFLNNKIAPVVLRDGVLLPELQQRGIQHEQTTDPEILYSVINDSAPMLGGTDRAHIALRRAILMVQDDQEFIRVIRKGQALHLPYPIPLGVVGEDRHYRSMLEYDPDAANALLDAFGFRPGADGYRRQPDGGPLTVNYWRRNEGETREYEELAKRGLDRIHIRFEGHAVPFSDLLKAQRNCQVPMALASWAADYPDGDDFMQLFYGPNTHSNNVGCFQNAEWDALYQRSATLDAGPERDALYHRMARLLEVDGVVKVSHSRLRHMVMQPRVLGFHKTALVAITEWPFLDLQ